MQHTLGRLGSDRVAITEMISYRATEADTAARDVSNLSAFTSRPVQNQDPMG